MALAATEAKPESHLLVVVLLAARALAVMAALDVVRAHLVGHSGSGRLGGLGTRLCISRKHATLLARTA
jgi:pimeloyl-ACP methyl ester carboxylesterase